MTGRQHEREESQIRWMTQTRGKSTQERFGTDRALSDPVPAIKYEDMSEPEVAHGGETFERRIFQPIKGVLRYAIMTSEPLCHFPRPSGPPRARGYK